MAVLLMVSVLLTILCVCVCVCMFVYACIFILWNIYLFTLYTHTHTPHLVSPLLYWWTLRLLHVFTSVNIAGIHIGVYLSFLSRVFCCGCLSKYSRVELLVHMVVLFLLCWETSILFFIVTAPIYIPTNDVLKISFIYIFPNFCYLTFW